MSTPIEAIEAECKCSVWAKDDDQIRFCAAHHQYFLGAKNLPSVTTIIRQCWPVKKNFEAADPAVLVHSRERGIRVDQYISEFVATGNVRIPKGEWREVVELVQKFVSWWQPTIAASQVILHDGEFAGTCDLLIPGDRSIWDIKCVWELDISYELQLGLYGLLYESLYKEPPLALGLIHLTKRYNEPRIVPLDVKQVMTNAATLVDMWRLVKRLTA